jgi:hypothetical protein
MILKSLIKYKHLTYTNILLYKKFPINHFKKIQQT